MFVYFCERCKAQIDPSFPVYELNIIYNMRSGTKSTSHYHWDCLKLYVKDDE